MIAEISTAHKAHCLFSAHRIFALASNVLPLELSMVSRMLTTLAGLLLIAAPAVMLARQTRSPDTPPQPGQLAQPAQSNNLPATVSAAPFSVRDKFDYRIVQSFGLRGFVGATLSAAVGQAANTPHEWGQGVEGYALRYGSSFGGNVTRQSFSWVLESAFREDPRYFPSDDKRDAKERLINALKQSFLTKTDRGGDEFAYARFISAFGAGQFVNIWLPRSDATVAKGIQRGAISIGADAAYNLLQEFIPFTRPISLRHDRPSAPTTP